MGKLTVAVDVDGVLAKYDGWKGPEHIGEPIAGAVEFTKKLGKNFEVLIFTTRTSGINNDDVELGKKRIEVWLNKHAFYYDRIYVGLGKPLAVAYIDDRAVPCCPQEEPHPELEYTQTLKNVELMLENVNKQEG